MAEKNKRIFITAELGINHNGNIEIAKKLIDISKECGSDAVKFQKRTVGLVYSKEFLAQQKSKPMSSEVKKKISITLMGHEISQETKDKISHSLKRYNNAKNR